MHSQVLLGAPHRAQVLHAVVLWVLQASLDPWLPQASPGSLRPPLAPKLHKAYPGFPSPILPQAFPSVLVSVVDVKALGTRAVRAVLPQLHVESLLGRLIGYWNSVLGAQKRPSPWLWASLASLASNRTPVWHAYGASVGPVCGQCEPVGRAWASLRPVWSSLGRARTSLGRVQACRGFSLCVKRAFAADVPERA